VRAVLRTLYVSRTFRHLLAAAIVVNFVGFSGMTFAHPFFVRAFHVGYTEAAIAFALINSLSLGAGYFLGGVITDKLAARDVRYYGWFPGVAMFLASASYFIGFSQQSWPLTILFLVPPGLFAGVFFAPTFAITHNLVEPRMRASATALLSLIMSILGMTLGPIVTGALSDAFAARAYGGDFAGLCQSGANASAACQAASAAGLRHALLVVVSVYALAGVHFLLAARHMPRELARPAP
jgi:MFS family permease